MEGRKEGEKEKEKKEFPELQVHHQPPTAPSWPTKLAIIHFWFPSWILEPSMRHHSPHHHRCCTCQDLQGTLPRSWHLSRGDTLLWDPISEVRSSLPSCCAWSEADMSGHTRVASNSPGQPGQARFLSLRQMSFSDLCAEELTRECTWFSLSEIPLENIRNLRGQQLSDIWGLSYYLFRVCPGQVALTEDIGNPWHHCRGARGRVTGRVPSLPTQLPPPVMAETVTALSAPTFIFLLVSVLGSGHGREKGFHIKSVTSNSSRISLVHQQWQSHLTLETCLTLNLEFPWHTDSIQ